MPKDNPCFELVPVGLNAPDVLRGGESEDDSILYWAAHYWQARVAGSAEGTKAAKKNDLQLFLGFFQAVVASDRVDYWTPEVSKAFKSWLAAANPKEPIRQHAGPYAPTSVNRILATLRHFSSFIQERRPFQAGSPFANVKDLSIELPEWKGLTDIELMRLRAALDQLCQLSTRSSQQPHRNKAVFMLLLHTGLRVSEVTALDRDQYQGKYLKNVVGKGEHYSDVYLSAEARRALDSYLDHERGRSPGPLFTTIRGNRLTRQQVDSFLRQLAAYANSKLPANEHIHLHAHKLRHTSIKRVHDDRGPIAAKRFSRHRSFNQLERYAAQTREEHEEMVEALFS